MPEERPARHRVARPRGAGQTDKDHTLYFEQMPSNQLDMVLFLEADRMRAPAITQENVNNQREAV